MHKKEVVKRCIVLNAGFFLMGLGVAMATNAGLGTSPISSPPLVLMVILGLTLGTFTFLQNAAMVAMQKVILGKAFPRRNLLQLLAVIPFCIYIDICMLLTQWLITDNYPYKILIICLGAAIMGLGIALELAAGLIVVPGEGLVMAIAMRWHLPIGRVKVLFDSTLVIIACLLSVVCLGELVGVREGTALYAVLVGTVLRFCSPLDEPLNRWMSH